MAKITFITPAGSSIVLEGTSGSVMELAVANGVPGIGGNCGGVCSCGTCHVYVTPEDAAKTGAAGALEKDMLEFDDAANERSRLCCQISLSEAIDGVAFTVVG